MAKRMDGRNIEQIAVVADDAGQVTIYALTDGGEVWTCGDYSESYGGKKWEKLPPIPKGKRDPASV